MRNREFYEEELQSLESIDTSPEAIKKIEEDLKQLEDKEKQEGKLDRADKSRLKELRILRGRMERKEELEVLLQMNGIEDFTQEAELPSAQDEALEMVNAMIESNAGRAANEAKGATTIEEGKTLTGKMEQIESVKGYYMTEVPTRLTSKNRVQMRKEQMSKNSVLGASMQLVTLQKLATRTDLSEAQLQMIDKLITYFNKVLDTHAEQDRKFAESIKKAEEIEQQEEQAQEGQAQEEQAQEGQTQESQEQAKKKQVNKGIETEHEENSENPTQATSVNSTRTIEADAPEEYEEEQNDTKKKNDDDKDKENMVSAWFKALVKLVKALLGRNDNIQKLPEGVDPKLATVTKESGNAEKAEEVAEELGKKHENTDREPTVEEKLDAARRSIAKILFRGDNGNNNWEKEYSEKLEQNPDFKIEDENEHDIGYQLDDFEIDRVQEIRQQIKELEKTPEGQLAAARRSIAKILYRGDYGNKKWGKEYSEKLKQNPYFKIEDENEHDIGYQLDDFEIDRVQEIRQKIKELEKMQEQDNEERQTQEEQLPFGALPKEEQERIGEATRKIAQEVAESQGQEQRTDQQKGEEK